MTEIIMAEPPDLTRLVIVNSEGEEALVKRNDNEANKRYPDERWFVCAQGATDHPVAWGELLEFVYAIYEVSRVPVAER